MIVKHKISNKCPKCGEILSLTINTEHHVEYNCEKCGYHETDNKSADVDLRYAPTFDSLPIIEI